MIQYTKNGNDLYFESHFQVFFKSSPTAILEAELSFNRGIITNTGLGSLDYFYQYLDLIPPKDANNWGWSYEYMAHDWNCCWVDFIHVPRITNEGVPYISIEYPMEPKPMDYLEGWYD